MEKSLPSEFGGGPGDYQLVEEEDDMGQTRLSLMVHPEIKELDEGRLLSRLQEGLDKGTGENLYTAKLWRESGTLRIKREAPRITPQGKILPLEIRH